MKFIKNILKKYPIIKEAFLYGLIGGTSALLDSLVFILLRKVNLEMYIANFIGINAGITLSFFLNTYYNFKKKDNLKKRAIRFYIIGYIGLLISMLIFYVFVDQLKWNEIIVKLFSVVVVAAIQFVLNKLITFRKGL